MFVENPADFIFPVLKLCAGDETWGHGRLQATGI